MRRFISNAQYGRGGMYLSVVGILVVILVILLIVFLVRRVR